jgi:hypothetical protein
MLMSTTGRFRNDLIAAAAGATREPVVAKPSTAVAGTPYANWLERMQRTRGRHAAITRNLYTWSNYKNWADRVRDSWDETEANGESSKAPGRDGRRPR